MRRRLVTGVLAVVAVVMVVLAVRSWTVDDDSRASTAVERFGSAVAAKDYTTICDGLLASELQRSLEAVGLPCEEALRTGLGDVKNPTLKLRSVVVDGDLASAAVASGATGQQPANVTLQLRRENGEWKIASLGGTPTRAGTRQAATPPTGTTGSSAAPVPGSVAGSTRIDPKAVDDTPQVESPTGRRGPASDAITTILRRKAEAKQRRADRAARAAQANRGGD